MHEFELIKKYFSKLANNSKSSLNLNDDVFFDKTNKLVLSVDTYIEGIHFVNFKKPELAIKKIIRSSISDLVCKGVKPRYYFLAGSGNSEAFSKNNLAKINKSLKEEQKERSNSPLFNESLSSELLEKQKKLQNLFDELIPEDLKKLMEELEKELDELNKDKSMEMLEKMSMTNEELNNELDRMMELFKQFEFEVKMDEIIDDLDELKKKQLNESIESKNKENELNKQKEKQDED